MSAGDVLCDVETDKATMAWESQDEGYVAAILLPGGSKDVPIGTPAVVLVEEQVRAWGACWGSGVHAGTLDAWGGGYWGHLGCMGEPGTGGTLNARTCK